MKKLLLPLVIIATLCLTIKSSYAQDMDNKTLEKAIYIVADSVKGVAGNWQFAVRDRLLICITDKNNNRMRIMTPIIEQKKLAYTDLLKLMEANFHTALDVKYAITNSVLWSVYIHPLKELSEEQVLRAIEQVYTAAHTYGSTYNSTGLTFPNSEEEQKEQIKKKKI